MGNYLYLRPLGVDQPQHRFAPVEAANPPSVDVPALAFRFSLLAPTLGAQIIYNIPKLSFNHHLIPPDSVGNQQIIEVPKLTFQFALLAVTLSQTVIQVPRTLTFQQSLLLPTLNKITYAVDKLSFTMTLHVPEVVNEIKQPILGGAISTLAAAPAPARRRRKKPRIEFTEEEITAEAAARRVADELRALSLAKVLTASILQPALPPLPVQTQNPLELLAKKLLPNLKGGGR